MAWIPLRSPAEDERVRSALEMVGPLFPIEYTSASARRGGPAEILLSHSLIPDALRHAFAALAAMFAPGLPLTRQQHEMIATVVSVANRCAY
jgi:alkylhydroperoxidase family enzyme